MQAIVFIFCINLGYEAGGSKNTSGGGSLLLDFAGIDTLGRWLIDSFQGFMGFRNKNIKIIDGEYTLIVIFWVGIGYAEEAILLALFVKRSGLMIKILIIGTILCLCCCCLNVVFVLVLWCTIVFFLVLYFTIICSNSFNYRH